MTPQAQTLTRFYTAFAALDADGMAQCYADAAQFDDAVFSLRGKAQVAGMWRMLCEGTKAKGRDAWAFNFSGIAADAHSGQAHWEADYRFAATGRLVHNVVDAQFTFNAQGLITSHRDHFNFWSWSRQALGTPGLLLGWTPMLHNKVRALANTNLQKFLTSKAAT
jgi:hypothetical protein